MYDACLVMKYGRPPQQVMMDEIPTIATTPTTAEALAAPQLPLSKLLLLFLSYVQC